MNLQKYSVPCYAFYYGDFHNYTPEIQNAERKRHSQSESILQHIAAISSGDSFIPVLNQ